MSNPRRFPKGTPADVRFWHWVDRDAPGGCWRWLGALNRDGYGRFRVDGMRPAAHQFAYRLLVGPIGDGLELDHLCRIRACVNPAHLEPVTHRANVLRGDAPAAVQARRDVCAKGHRLEGDNLYVIAGGKRAGGRRCRTCLLASGVASTRRYRARRRAAA